MGLIETIKNSCHECYACVRNCPVKAVRVSNGQAEVLEKRCIQCGNCVRICSSKAKKVLDYKEQVKDFFRQHQRVVIGLAPSFPAYEPEIDYAQWVDYLNTLGFTKIYEVAWGAQLVIEEYKKFLEQNKQQLMISTACPVIVNLIEKYYPTLVPGLVPIASPMVALARYIAKNESPGTKIVLVGPCLAKKKEVDNEETIDAVLTYTELLELGRELAGLELQEMEKFQTSTRVGEKHPNLLYINHTARRIPLAGGLLAGVMDKHPILPEGFLRAEGSAKVFELLDSLVKGELEPRFIDLLYCEGCISGVDLTRESFFKKSKAIESYIQQREYVFPNLGTYSHELANHLDLSMHFEPDYQSLPQPTEKDIWKILNETNKVTTEDLLNCGACGYPTCREKAIAVYQGLAEVEMCLSYLLTEKREEVIKIQTLNNQLDMLINSSYDGMLVVNSDGVVERVNHSYAGLLEQTIQNLVGKNVADLERAHLIYPAVSTLALREKRNITLVQNTWNGKRILATATPIFDEQQVLRVLVNARDICELNKLEMKADEGKKICQYLKTMEHTEAAGSPAHIVYRSGEMRNILKLARQIAQTSSTVLITGESGVGKEVIARYIHEQSGRKNKLITINCGAIPETLLESELFGYETGAFSGAKREGKPGLIEMANQGTLFLDEIGDMPLNLQVKLLQVLQEHQVTRLGGVERIAVDFRVIAATNRDLKARVQEKEFREDLYYRLHVVPITIPNLRERKEDIAPLINYWLNLHNRKYQKTVQLTEGAEKLLIHYDWPGNIRELANLMERLVVTCEDWMIDVEMINNLLDIRTEQKSSIAINAILPLEEAVEEVERQLLQLAKESCSSTYEMAKMLGVNQSTVVRKLKKYFS